LIRLEETAETERLAGMEGEVVLGPELTD